MAARITSEQKRFVVKHITLGATAKEIGVAFEKQFGRPIHPMSVSRIRHDNVVSIAQGREIIGAEAVTSATLIKQKTNQLLEARLDDAIEDSVEIRKLRRELRNGTITPGQFKQKVEVYEQLTINELVKVSDAMAEQSKNDKNDTPLSPTDQAALAALVAGIQAGNPVQLIQLIQSKATENPEA